MSHWLPGWLNFLIYLPLLCIAVPFALLSYCFLPALKRRGPSAVWRVSQSEVTAFQVHPDRLVVAARYDADIGADSIFQAPWLLRRMEKMLRAAGLPEIPPDEQRLRAAARRWNLSLDCQEFDQLNRLHKDIHRLWRQKPAEREDVLRLALWRALACDRLMGKDQRGLAGFVERVLN